jgi:hypothetical protein
MATRTPIIKGRVLRNLKRRGFTLDEVNDEEIYSELTQAQNDILDDITPHYDTRFPTTSTPAVIDANTDPVIPSIWDKALEYKATSEFLADKSRMEFVTLFDNELKAHRGSAQRTDKHEPISREPGIRGEFDIGGGKGFPDRDSRWY